MPTTNDLPHRVADEPFFNRTTEIGVVDRWLELAADGTPRIGIVGGAPGVGKSRFLRAVADRAQRRGFRVLRGSGYYETPPLLPVLTAIAPLIDQARNGRRPDLSDDDVEALNLLTEAGVDRPADDDPRRGRTDDTQRYLAASRLVLGAARSRPILLAIDDAHALDDASAALIAHLTAAAVHQSEELPVRLLTQLAIRPGAGRRVARRTASRLRAEQGGAELLLEGLHEVDLNELLASFGPAPPSRPLLRTVGSRTGGNPLFARLLWTHLLDTGAAVTKGDRVVLADPAAVETARVGLDEVVDERVDALRQVVRDLLGVAAVLGTEGDIDVLARTTDQPRELVEDLLSEADEAGVCRVNGDRYRFDHPLLVASLGRTYTRQQRRRLHLDIAMTMADLDHPPALDIASHLRSAGSLAPADARRLWGVAAADRAMELGAWGDAVAGFGLALDDGLEEGFAPEYRVELYTRAARAGAADHDLENCERFGLAAVGLAQELNDLETWCEAVSELGHARVRVAQGGAPEPVAELEQFIEAAGDRVPHLRARVLGLMAEVSFAAFDFDRGLEFARAARELAEEEGDDDVVAFVSFAQGLQHQGRLELDESDRCFAESVEHGDATDSFVSGWARARLPSAHWLRGELTEAEAAAAEAELHASARMDWAELSLISAWRANVAGASGRFADAEVLAERALALQRRSDYAFTQIVANPPLAIARAMRGNVEGAHRGLDEWREIRSTRWIDQLDTLVDALAGNTEAVNDALDDRPWRVLTDDTIDLRRASALFAQIEVGVFAGAADLVVPARPALDALHERGVRFAPGSLSLLSRLCAAAAALERDVPGARRWLATARADAERSGAGAELARCDLDEAVLLRESVDDADPATIDRLLTAASVTFDRLGMLPFLRRAEQLLGSSSTNRTTRARKVILFTDLVGSTSLNVTAGDEAYLQLLRAHDRVVRDGLRRHGGVEFKHTGDGVAAWFRSARQAVTCALDLQDTLAGALHAESGVEVRVRCGLAAGEPIESSGDLFGLSVARASRICAMADGGMVLVSDEIPPMAVGSGLRFTDRGAVVLRGIPGEIHVLSAHADGD